MTVPVLDKIAKTDRHTTFYLSCGDPAATPVIFVHGWPELSISWRHQLPVIGGLGFHAVAPDMRGYGRSSVYPRHEDYAQSQIVPDMIELLDHLGAEKAVFVGHDWGAPVVWSLAQHHPERCLAVANLCVPYMPNGFAVENYLSLIDRTVYPQDQFPFGQWDYMKFYEERFDDATAGFEGNIRNFVRAAFRAGNPAGKGKPSGTAFTRANGGWFGGGSAPAFPRDDTVLTERDENTYTAALERNGFFGPDSWYMNARRNTAYAATAKAPRLTMPVLFLHAAYDYVCETIDSRLAEPMRENCADLTEAVVNSGHWMAQEKPIDVNAHLTKWLAAKLREAWR